MKWIEAYLTSRQSAHRLSIAAIKNLAEDIPKTEKIDHLIEQLADRKREAASLSDEELDLLELYSFYINMHQYQSPARYFKPGLSQYDIEKISSEPSSKTSAYGGLTCIYSDVKLQTKLDMQANFEDLARISEELCLPPHALAFGLTSNNHAIGVAYLGSQHWQLTNINDEESVVCEKILYTEQMIDVVFNALKVYSEEIEVSYLEGVISEAITKSMQDYRNADKEYPDIRTFEILYEGSTFSLIYLKELSLWLFTDDLPQMLAENSPRFLSATQLAREIFVRVVTPTPYLAYSLEVITLRHFERQFALRQRYQALTLTSQQITQVHVNSGELHHYAFICSKMGKIDEVEKLITEGINLTVLRSHRKMSLLHAAVDNNHIDIVKLLLSQFIDLNVQDIDGLTPIYFAVQNGFEDIVILLKELGADITGVNINSPEKSLIELANLRGFHEIAVILAKSATKVRASESTQTLFQQVPDIYITEDIEAQFRPSSESSVGTK